MKLTNLFEDFFKSEKTGGLTLIFCTVISLILANSAFQTSYLHFWHISLAGNSVEYWINDALMAIFFLLIGLELEREVYIGELSDLKSASLPVIAAIGGMVVPAALYLVFNSGSATQSGAGIPMATDIAFAVGILSILGSRVPSSLKVFLTALAVIDDLGAILIIAIFYTGSLSFVNLFVAFAIFGGLIILNRLKIRNLLPYLIGGVAMWYFMLHSGIHSTITGVLLAFTIPFDGGVEKSPSTKLLHFLHKPVAYIILPLFALANTGIVLAGGWQVSLTHASSLGIFAGLIIGKPLGIFLFSFLGAGIGLCSLPGDLKWKHIVGAGFLAGIGFTMSIFITMLAFDRAELVNFSKLAVLAASLIAGTIGFFWLRASLKRETPV
ncbi:MAG: Na+/H+ antiporter NhaA [Bacteroidota bacterium]